MRSQQLQEKLKHAYHQMVENIENLTLNDGKSLSEATQIAEEKLSDMKELTKEQAQKISAMVVNDVHSIGETLSGAKTAYKEQFKLDTAYLTETLWEKMSKVADVGTEEFLEFTENLKERANKRRTDDHASEHKEHSEWHEDHAFWLDEIAFWKKDHKDALEKLKKIEESIKKHGDLLDEHAQAIQAHEKMDQQHEEVMKEAEIDPTSHVFESDDDKDTDIHQQQREEHKQHAELHESLKKHHRQMMSMLNNLYKQVINKS